MEEQKKEPDKMRIVGLNIGIFAVYTLICAVTPLKIFSAIVPLGFHLVACFVLAIVYRNWVWVLSAGLLVLIGFSTCVLTIMSS